MTIRRLAACVVLACAPLALLGGCVKAPPPATANPLTVASTGDASGTYTKGQTLTLTFKVANPSHAPLEGVYILASAQAISGAPPNLVLVQSLSCTAQAGACPTPDRQGLFSNGTIGPGASLTFTVTGTIADNYDGDVDVRFSAQSLSSIDAKTADAHVTLVDARDGDYVLFGTSGRVANVTISFKPGDKHWRVSSDSAPMPFTHDNGSDVFANGSRLNTGHDLLNGTYDFGAGPEAFIAVRQFASDLAALDGASFTLFSATPAGTGPRAVAVQPAWIAGSTLTLCQDSVPRTAATCPGTAQAHYAITQDGVMFSATDGASGDTFQFHIANTGTSRVLLRGDSNGSAGFFAIGLPPAAVPTDFPSYMGTSLGAWTLIALDPASDRAATYTASTSNFGSFGPDMALQVVAGAPTGLRQGIRSDGVAIEVASSPALMVQTGAPGQIEILGRFQN